jgi:hypothetical protein
MTDRREVELPADASGIDQPHDVLAAEEFALPARSAGDVPPDPSGIQEPHDVLAAEEFAMPTGDVEGHGGGVDLRTFLPGLALAAALGLLVRVLRRRRG